MTRFSATTLLERLGRLGVGVSVDGDELTLSGPMDSLDDALVEEVRGHKAELLAHLRAGAETEDEEGDRPGIDVRTWIASKLLWRDAIPPGCSSAGPTIRTSLTDAEVEALVKLARDGVVVEIGSAYGYSTVAMARVAERVISVDPHSGLGDSLEVLRSNLAQHGVYDRVEVVVDTSQEFCAKTPPTDVDLVFIDGDHSYEATLHDLQCAAKMLRPTGAVAVHDYMRLESVREAVDVARADAEVTVVDSLAIIKPFRFHDAGDSDGAPEPHQHSTPERPSLLARIIGVPGHGDDLDDL